MKTGRVWGCGLAGLLCISSYEKGQAFLREASRLGVRVTLLTVEKLRGADWPWDALAEFHTMPEGLTAEQVLPFVTRLARHREFDRVVALDEFDLESAALVREHLRLPGMGQSRTRFFRDKLAMRMGARDGGVAVPEFFPVANHDLLYRFLESHEGPWLLKPRWSASAIGIRKFERTEEVWPLLEALGDEASNHLVERFVPGEIYHVEGFSWGGEVLLDLPHKYAQPPFETMHRGGVFSTRTLDREGEEAKALVALHRQMLRALGMESGVTHSEFIRAHADGRFYFLETAARVGGAYIAEVAEAGSGLNPWVEWARMEVAQMRGESYALPSERRADYAASVICLARQEWPDTAGYTDAEIVHRLRKHHHAGLIVRSAEAARVEALQREYMGRFFEDFYARMEAPDRPTN